MKKEEAVFFWRSLRRGRSVRHYLTYGKWNFRIFKDSRGVEATGLYRLDIYKTFKAGKSLRGAGKINQETETRYFNTLRSAKRKAEQTALKRYGRE